MAISYFTSKGYIISLPLNDNQDYDLVVEINNKLNKVQVKTSFSKDRNNNYKVYLRTITSSITGVEKIKSFDEVKCDLVFIATEEGNMYMINKKDINTKRMLTLTEDKEQYLVGKTMYK